MHYSLCFAIKHFPHARKNDSTSETKFFPSVNPKGSVNRFNRILIKIQNARLPRIGNLSFAIQSSALHVSVGKVNRHSTPISTPHWLIGYTSKEQNAPVNFLLFFCSVFCVFPPWINITIWQDRCWAYITWIWSFNRPLLLLLRYVRERA